MASFNEPRNAFSKTRLGVIDEFVRHCRNVYPSPLEYRILASISGMTVSQVQETFSHGRFGEQSIHFMELLKVRSHVELFQCNKSINSTSFFKNFMKTLHDLQLEELEKWKQVQRAEYDVYDEPDGEWGSNEKESVTTLGMTSIDTNPLPQLTSESSILYSPISSPSKSPPTSCTSTPSSFIYPNPSPPKTLFLPSNTYYFPSESSNFNYSDLSPRYFPSKSLSNLSTAPYQSSSSSFEPPMFTSEPPATRSVQSPSSLTWNPPLKIDLTGWNGMDLLVEAVEIIRMQNTDK